MLMGVPTGHESFFFLCFVISSALSQIVYVLYAKHAKPLVFAFSFGILFTILPLIGSLNPTVVFA